MKELHEDKNVKSSPKDKELKKKRKAYSSLNDHDNLADVYHPKKIQKTRHQVDDADKKLSFYPSTVDSMLSQI